MSDVDELSRTVRAVVEQVLAEMRSSAGYAAAPPAPADPPPTLPDPPPAHQPVSRLIPAQPRRVAIGADHGGYPMKEALKPLLAELGYAVEDCGTFSADAVDYPDFAVAVARRVAAGVCWRGIMIDGAGIGSCMAANKVAGVRASMCYDLSTPRNAREPTYEHGL